MFKNIGWIKHFSKIYYIYIVDNKIQMEEKYRLLDYFEDRKVSGSISRSAKSARTRLFHGPPLRSSPFRAPWRDAIDDRLPRDSFCPEEIEFQIWEQNCYE